LGLGYHEVNNMAAASHRWLGMASLFFVVFAGCGHKGIGIPVPGQPKVITPTPAVRAPVAAPVVKEDAPPAEAVEKKAETPAGLPAEKVPAGEGALPAAKSAASESSPAVAIGEPPAAEGEPAAKAPPIGEALYADSFADVKGSVKRHVEGKTVQEVPGNTRTVYMFRGMPEEGALVLQVLEDMKTSGPDEKPGVLALSWQEVPGKLPYCGFVYVGRAAAAERLTLPPVQTAKSAADLKDLRISFRYRAVNVKAAEKGDAAEGAKATEPVKVTMGWRFEPMLADSYKKRLDFGKITATDEWGTVDVCLKDGTNMEAFLRMLADEHPTAFKIVWAQGDSIANYHAGDTLLIDDIVVKSVPAK
jgi:hypothetical protein